MRSIRRDRFLLCTTISRPWWHIVLFRTGDIGRWFGCRRGREELGRFGRRCRRRAPTRRGSWVMARGVTVVARGPSWAGTVLTAFSSLGRHSAGGRRIGRTRGNSERGGFAGGNGGVACRRRGGVNGGSRKQFGYLRHGLSMSLNGRARYLPHVIVASSQPMRRTRSRL